MLLLLAGLVAVAVVRKRRRGGDDDDLFGPAPGSVSADDEDFGPGQASGGYQDEGGREDTLFGDRYAREGLGSLSSGVPAPPTPSDDFPSGPLSFWGAPVGSPSDAEGEAVQEDVGQEDPDSVDTAPTRIPDVVESARDNTPTDEPPRAAILQPQVSF